MRENKVVILADGNFPKSSYPLELLYGADTIVCCDNSIVKLLEHTNLMADYIVGDMDSLSADNKIKFKVQSSMVQKN